MAVLTPAQIATLKPYLVVRTREEFRKAVLLAGVLYLLAFHAVALVWRLRGIRGDRAPAGSGAPAHRHRLCGAAEPRRSAARQPAVRALRGRQSSAGLPLMAASRSSTSAAAGPGAQLSAACWRPVAVGAVDPVRHRPGHAAARKVNLGPVQPIEAIRLLLALFLAGFFARRWELLRDMRGQSFRDDRVCRDGSTCRAANTCCRSWSVSASALAVLLSSEGSRAGAVAVLRLPGGLCRRARPDRDGGRRVRAAGRSASMSATG